MSVTIECARRCQAAILSFVSNFSTIIHCGIDRLSYLPFIFFRLLLVLNEAINIITLEWRPTGPFIVNFVPASLDVTCLQASIRWTALCKHDYNISHSCCTKMFIIIPPDFLRMFNILSRGIIIENISLLDSFCILNNGNHAAFGRTKSLQKHVWILHSLRE